MGFTEDQRKVIEYGKGTLLVEAGPGSGKTTVIVERIKHLIKIKKENGEEIDPESFLVITFTKKATENLKYKLRKELSSEFASKMKVSTIHSFCFDYLKKFSGNKDKYSALTLVDDDASLKKSLFIKKSIEDLGFVKEYSILDYQIPAVVKKFEEYASFKVDTPKLTKWISDSRPIAEDFRDFVKPYRYFSKKRIEDYDVPINKEIDRIKRQLKKVDDEQLKMEKEEEIKELKKKLFKNSWYNATYFKIAESYPEYLDLLDKNNCIDYNVLQSKTYEELKANPLNPYDVIFIDEFQDTDPLQFRIFEILSNNCDYFTAVGDVDQHIYAFRSSYNDFFDEFKSLVHPKSLPLNVNFRSTENIVKLTEEFIAPQRKGNSDKDMKNHRRDCNNHNFLIENSSSEDEAVKIFEIIKYLMENNIISDYSDVAILYRKHSDTTISELINIFTENGIGFSVKGRKDLDKKEEVQTFLKLMWYIVRRTDMGYVPSGDELGELNLKALCGEYFETSFFSLADSTKEYLCRIQDEYYDEVLKREENIVGKNGVIHKLRDRRDLDTLYDIFEGLQLPIVDIEKITDSRDKEFFRQLEIIRNEIKPQKSLKIENSESENPQNEEDNQKPLTIIDLFYKLIALGNLYDYEFEYEEIANLAILTQIISNYESFISETDYRGIFFFLNRTIENYDSYQKEGKGVQLMSIHSAKGLEFPVTFITSLKKGKFPSSNRDPTSDYSNGTANYYTPNEFLEYKTIIDENGDCQNLSIEEENLRDIEEEDRVLYVAMTRAEDLLLLSTIGEVPDQIERIRHRTESFSYDKLSEVEITSGNEKSGEEKEFEDELESLEEPVVLNYSKYTQYLSCPFKFDLSNNLGFVRSGSAKAANRGTVFHNIMEELNLKLIDGEVVDDEELKEIMDNHYKPMFDIEKEPEEYEKFKGHVENYYKKYSLNRETLESEFKFELFIDNYILNGAIDLIYRDTDGEIKILDYKYAEFKEDHIGGYIKQSYIYASALRRIPEYEDYEIKKAIIHFVKDDKQYEVEIDEDKMRAEFEKIEEVSRNIKEGVFEKDPENDKECASCSYRYFCKPKDYANELYE